MPELIVTENVPSTTDDVIKSVEQIDLENAETAIIGKDFQTARTLLERLGTRLVAKIFSYGFVSISIDRSST
jgi:hypothetical protein